MKSSTQLHIITFKGIYSNAYFVRVQDFTQIVTEDSRFSTSEDAALFLTLVCGYNNIKVDREPTEVLNELITFDEVALSGGIAFEDKNKVILPSCCCGLENWRDVLEAVQSKKDVWLGHDPFPAWNT